MIEDALLKDYFNLTEERRSEIMNVVYDRLRSAYRTLEVTTSKSNAKQVLNMTLSTEMNKALEKENYEYAEIINQIIEHMDNAID